MRSRWGILARRQRDRPGRPPDRAGLPRLCVHATPGRRVGAPLCSDWGLSRSVHGQRDRSSGRGRRGTRLVRGVFALISRQKSGVRSQPACPPKPLDRHSLGDGGWRRRKGFASVTSSPLDPPLRTSLLWATFPVEADVRVISLSQSLFWYPPCPSDPSGPVHAPRAARIDQRNRPPVSSAETPVSWLLWRTGPACATTQPAFSRVLRR